MSARCKVQVFLRKFIHKCCLAIVIVVQLLSWVQLFATLQTVACQVPLSMGFPRQEYWVEWVAISFFRVTSQARDQTHISCLSGGFFTDEPLRKPSTATASMRANKQSILTTEIILKSGILELYASSSDLPSTIQLRNVIIRNSVRKNLDVRETFCYLL